MSHICNLTASRVIYTRIYPANIYRRRECSIFNKRYTSYKQVSPIQKDQEVTFRRNAL